MNQGPMLTTSEWATAGPADCPLLKGTSFEQLGISPELVNRLNASRAVRLTELRSGLQIETRSHVGRLQLGEMTLIIRPKLQIGPLLRLLRYAFGLRRLELLSPTGHAVEELSFEDLLIHQLVAEVQELFARGVHKSYVPQNERLGSPRGRIDLQQFIRDAGVVTARLPCRHHPRIDDNLLNRAVKSGLRLAGDLATSVAVQRDCHRLVLLIGDGVSNVRVNRPLLDRAECSMSRLTAAYQSALTLIRLLLDGQGIVLEGEQAVERLPGFLFDMNLFFEALLGRFLKENLSDHDVLDQCGLRGMLRYHPLHNPRHRGTPTPRPDFVIRKGPRSRAILDAKYRDLWERELPREMLYQLIVYAISQPDRPESTILYPAAEPAAREARIDVADPVRGAPLGRVVLRPLSLEAVDRLIAGQTSNDERKAYAARLAFGGTGTEQVGLPAKVKRSPKPIDAPLQFHGRMTDRLGINERGKSYGITDALVTSRRIKMRWTENRQLAELEAESADAVHYEGTIRYRGSLETYSISLKRAVSADGSITLIGHWKASTGRLQDSCVFQLAPGEPPP